MAVLEWHKGRQGEPQYWAKTEIWGRVVQFASWKEYGGWALKCEHQAVGSHLSKYAKLELAKRKAEQLCKEIEAYYVRINSPEQRALDTKLGVNRDYGVCAN